MSDEILAIIIIIASMIITFIGIGFDAECKEKYWRPKK